MKRSGCREHGRAWALAVQGHAGLFVIATCCAVGCSDMAGSATDPSRHEHPDAASAADTGDLSGAEEEAPGRIRVLPDSSLRFSVLQPGNSETRSLDVRNAGVGVLGLTEVAVMPGTEQAFLVVVSPRRPEPGRPVLLLPGSVDDSLRLDVTYQPPGPGVHLGTVILRADDPRVPELPLTLLGQAALPCVQALPETLVFRPLQVGTDEEGAVEVVNCGETPVVVQTAGLAEDSSPAFRLVEVPDGLDSGCLGAEPSPCAGRRELAGGEVAEFVVRYRPEGRGVDRGRLLVQTDIQGGSSLELPVRGAAFDSLAPVANCRARVGRNTAFVTSLGEGHALQAPTRHYLLLSGTDSFAPEGNVIGFEWSVVERPWGSKAELERQEDGSEAAFFLDLTGRYVFGLSVRDDAGRTSDPGCRLAVDSVPNQAIYIELVWETGPGVGAHLAVHLQRGEDPWFCFGDCFQGDGPFSRPCDWGARPRGNPRVAVEDRDGSGPEILVFQGPEEDRRYRLGVAYARDAGAGPATAAVRAHIRGGLALSLDRLLPGEDHFWDVATISWPSGDVATTDEIHAFGWDDRECQP